MQRPRRRRRRGKGRNERFEGRGGRVSKRIDISGELLRGRSTNTILAYNERQADRGKKEEQELGVITGER